jgi:hypothetical protein
VEKMEYQAVSEKPGRAGVQSPVTVKREYINRMIERGVSEQGQVQISADRGNLQ